MVKVLKSATWLQMSSTGKGLSIILILLFVYDFTPLPA